MSDDIDVGHDILDAIAKFRVAFRRHDLEPPSVILVDSFDTGMKILSLLKQVQEPYFTYTPNWDANPVKHPDGSVWMEIEVMGMKIRWPGRKYALQGGGYIWT